MSQTTIIVLAVLVALILAALLVLRSRKQHVAFGESPRPPAVPPAPEERHGIGSEVTAAVEDVIDQFVGLDAHPSGNQAQPGPGDTLTRLKGLGPKAASRLAQIGVTRFAQIASWDAGDVAAIDAQMGAFKGRIVRDRWVEQARLLAAGDTAAFEAQFGKLGDSGG